MPDPARHTVSATEAPMLFNASPYGTRWTLWQKFANGVEIPYEENERMSWGTKMQPLLLQEASYDLKLEVQAESQYVSRGSLGCTRDATVYCPDRGPGALETKCVFDYRTWMQKWGGGTFVPREIEIQLQVQMFVGDGATLEFSPHTGRDGHSYNWGIIAVWVAAQMYYFERQPVPELWGQLERESRSFLISVRDRIEPDPFGVPLELPLIQQLYPTREGDYLDLRDDDAESIIQLDKSISYLAATTQRRNANKVAESLRAEFIAKLKGHHKMLIGGGAVVEMGKQNRLKVYVPGIPEVEGNE